jgi:hypothetical protein
MGLNEIELINMILFWGFWTSLSSNSCRYSQELMMWRMRSFTNPRNMVYDRGMNSIYFYRGTIHYNSSQTQDGETFKRSFSRARFGSGPFYWRFAMGILTKKHLEFTWRDGNKNVAECWDDLTELLSPRCSTTHHPQEGEGWGHHYQPSPTTHTVLWWSRRWKWKLSTVGTKSCGRPVTAHICVSIILYLYTL